MYCNFVSAASFFSVRTLCSTSGATQTFNKPPRWPSSSAFTLSLLCKLSDLLKIVFCLLTFPPRSSPCCQSISLYFWPTFTCILNPCLRHLIVVDRAGAFWISQRASQLRTHAVNQLCLHCHEMDSLWLHVTGSVAAANEAMYVCIDSLEKPSGDVKSVLPHPCSMYSSPLWLPVCPACCLLNITVLKQQSSTKIQLGEPVNGHPTTA